MRISDWSSDVCSSGADDLPRGDARVLGNRDLPDRTPHSAKRPRPISGCHARQLFIKHIDHINWEGPMKSVSKLLVIATLLASSAAIAAHAQTAAPPPNKPVNSTPNKSEERR